MAFWKFCVTAGGDRQKKEKERKNIMEENNNELQAPVVSLGEWIVTYILCCIPCVNIIMLFVWAFGGNTNPSKKIMHVQH